MQTAQFFSIVRLTKNVFMCVAFACMLYIFYFVLVVYKKPFINPNVAPADVQPPEEEATFDPEQGADVLLPEVTSRLRDIFVNQSGQSDVAQISPAGQLPPQFKVVGLIVGPPAEVIIEDTNVRQTYFIAKQKPQGGISLLRQEGQEMVLSYQGQEIKLTIESKTKAPHVQIP